MTTVPDRCRRWMPRTWFVLALLFPCAAQAAPGGISGQVTSANNGATLSGLSVTVSDAATGGFVQSFLTDVSGRYDTGQILAPGLYKVSTTGPGRATVAYNNKFSIATGDPVAVSDGSTTTGIDIALPLLGGITGRVTNVADNSALGGAVVDVYDYAANTFVTSSAPSAADGSYTITNLNPLQAYRVRARLTNFGAVFFNNKPSAGAADVVTVPTASTIAIDFALTAAGGIRGTVTDAATLLPVQGVSVDVIDGASTNFSINNFVNFGVTTDASGNFNTGRAFAPGVYKLRARKVGSGYIQTFHPNGFDLSTATTVTVTAGADALSANIAIPMGGTITGTIRDRASNQPIVGAGVAAQRVASSSFFGDFAVTTDANGNYTITGLHPGEWLIYAQATGHILAWYSGDPNNLATDFSSATSIQITGTSTVSNVNLNLQLGGGQVRGRVTRTDNGQPITPGTQVTIWGPWPRATTITQLRALTNGQGDYSFAGLAPGRYYIQADRSQLPNGTAIGFFPFGAISRSTGTYVTVTAGGVVTADFLVLGFTGNATPRSISGTLKDPNNNLIQNAFVLAYQPTDTSLVRVVGAFHDGSFVMDGLAPGRYLLSVQTEKTFVWAVYPAELTLNTGTPIDVTAADVTGINFVVPNNAGTITGTVTRSDNGQPVLGAEISVRAFLDGRISGDASSADGTYLVRGVTPGLYKVRVSAPGFVTTYFSVNAPGGARTLEDGSFVAVASGVATPNINVVLDPTAGVLTGTVTKLQGILQPVVGAIVVIDDAASGNRVTAISTDATGTWRTESLGPGTYKVLTADIQAARSAVQWYNGKTTLLSADPVSVAASGVTGGIDFLVSPNQGSISGRVFLSDGLTPLPNAVVEILDSTTGGLVRRALAGSDGRYSAQGLAPGANLYVTRARALGFVTRAAVTPLTVTNGGDTPNINFNLTRGRSDFDADGQADILWRNAGTGEVAIFLMNGFTLLNSALVGTVNPAWSIVGVGDFNGDGQADILWRNADTGDNAIFLMNGFTITNSALIGNINPAWSVVGVGDFNGDGKADILWRNTTSGDNAIFLMDGFTTTSSRLIDNINPSWSVVGIGDFDGDGKADILWRNADTGDNAIFLMNGFTITNSALIGNINSAWSVVGVGDFNGDGKADILWRKSTTGDNAIFLMNGFSLANSALIPAVANPNWVVAGVADYDGDGKADILWRNTSTGDNAIFLMNGFTLTNSALIPSVPTSWAIINK